jgi:anti-sigma B factor antagonist
MTPPSTHHGGSSDGARIWVTHRPECVVVTISGEVDDYSTARLAHTLQAVTPTALALVLDLTDLEFMDSSGLGVLISARNQASHRGIPMVLAHPPRLVQRLLTSTQTQRSFPAYDTLDEAVAALKNS